VTKFKYFFGSDERSVHFLNTIYKNNENIKIVTLQPSKQGRGRKVKPNKVELFALKNNIEYTYYSENSVYEDMDYGIVASFSKIFSDNFIKKNKNLYNIHLSILPELRGPTPVENTILKNFDFAGYTIFQINQGIDTGKILYQFKFKVNTEIYASEIYKYIYYHFENQYNLINFNSNLKNQNAQGSLTFKFSKSDFNITGQTLADAKRKIRAFDAIGPAYIIYKNKFLKIHNYFLDEITPGIELIDGIIYPNEVTPEGKKRMNFHDYTRGLKWLFQQVFKQQIN